jgi:hypothetical protein
LIFQVLSFGSKTIQEDIVTEIAATMAFSATQNNDRIDFIFRPNRIIHSTKKGRSHIANYSRIDRISTSKAIKRILPSIEVLSSTKKESNRIYDF